MKKILVIFGGLLMGACCSSDDDLVPSQEVQARIAVFIVEDSTHVFEGGKIYEFTEPLGSYNLLVENVSASDAGYIKVFLQENKQLLYHATQIFMGNGEIVVPNPITPPDQFEYVITNDYVFMPESAVELTNLGADNAENYWGVIQGLKIVRAALQMPDSKIHYFKQDLDGGFSENTKWVFIIKY
jgi:hypothetical protein